MEQDDSKQMFLEAYDAHADAIYRHCYFRVFSRARAEELAQETFMKTWQYISDGKKVKNIRAFLYQVANNLIIDEHRKRKEESLDHMQEEGDFEPSSDDHLKLQSGALAKEVMGVIRQLGSDEKEVLVMRYVDDLDPREIAEVLGITANAVSVRIHRATQSLKKMLGE